MHSVIFYCPDRHIVYDGRTPIERGVGGGITQRVRMARALAQMGHHVTAVVNCPRREVIDGVQYVPLGGTAELRADVLIANTSGGAYDLSEIAEMTLDIGLCIVRTMGTAQPKGLGGLRVDFIYPESNFANRMVRDRWSLDGVKRFVAYAAVDEELFLEAEKDPPERDPYRMVYFSHPSKGLAAAKGVLRELRRVDPRFHLAVFGGEALWGGTPSPSDGETAVEEFGLVAQPALVRHLLGSSYSICLQSREEPFGMVVTESMRAGLVVLASPVGAYPELVQHGKNGFLLDGDPDSVETWKQASTLILQLDSRPEEAREIRKRARRVPWSTARMARVWTEHWDWWFGGGHAGQESGCEVCGGPRLRLSDGLHCLDCGNYTCDALVWEGEPA